MTETPTGKTFIILLLTESHYKIDTTRSMRGRHHTDKQPFCHRTCRIIFKRIMQEYRASTLAGSVQFRTEPVARSCGSRNETSQFIKFSECNYVNYRLLKKDSATQSSLFSYVVSWLFIHYTFTTGSSSNLGFNHTKTEFRTCKSSFPKCCIYCSSNTWNLEGHDSTNIPEWWGRGDLTTL
jgi:hypothetical protein